MGLTSEFTNEFGEKWIFQFDPVTGISTVKGSDVDWTSYPVIEGEPIDLIMHNSELDWLKSTWHEAVRDSKYVSLYCGVETDFAKGKKSCYLTNDYCPLCLKQKSSFQAHHCIWSMDGGTYDYFNMLMVCNTCHVILTSGNDEDRIPKDLAAFNHQLMYFGFGFFPLNNPAKGKHMDRNFLIFNPDIKRMIDLYESSNDTQKRDMNDLIQTVGRIKYQYFRDMGLGKWPWDEFAKRLNKLRQSKSDE